MSQASERIKKLAEYVAVRNAKEEPKRAQRMRDALVEMNRPLAIRLSRRYGIGGEDEDVLQAALIGVTRALETYEPGKGSFSTYAAYWIRHEVQQALQHATSIRRTRQHRIPAPVAAAANKWRLTHGCEPTPEDLGVSRSDWDDWTMAPGFVSIQDDDSDQTSPYTILGTSDHDGSNPEALTQELEAALAGLSERSRDLIVAFYVEAGGEISIAELAKSKGIPVKTAELVISKARRHLQRALGVTEQ